jgi:hypothetical protein
VTHQHVLRTCPSKKTVNWTGTVNGQSLNFDWYFHTSSTMTYLTGPSDLDVQPRQGWSSTRDSAPSEARKRGSGGGPPRKSGDPLAGPSDLSGQDDGKLGPFGKWTVTQFWLVI